MQVFKLFMKITRKNLRAAFIYIGIFLIISVVMANQGNPTGDFEETKLDVCVMDNDNTQASKALTDYIGKSHNLVDVENNKDAILDSLYYVQADYILTINEGYQDKISKGQTDGLFTNYKMPQSYTGEFLDNSIDEYIKTLSIYAEGKDISTALSDTENALSQTVSVTKENFNENINSGASGNIIYYFQYLAYIFIAILVSVLCPVILVINAKEVKNRTNCSSISSSSQTMQIFLGSSVFILGIWLIFMIAVLIFVKGQITKYFCLAVLNSFVFMLVSAGITILIASFSPGRKIVDMIANVLSLGMSFLCGIFVPQSLLGSGVLKAARFLPAYWYVRANNMLFGINGEIYSAKGFFSLLGVEMLFAVALFAVVMLVFKTKHDAKV